MKQRKVLIIGSLSEEPSEEKLQFLQEFIFGLLDRGCKVVNSNGRLLGQYVTANVVRYAVQKKFPVTLDSYMMQYVPMIKEVFPKCYSDRDVLASYLRSDFFAFADTVVVIGGGDGTAKEVDLFYKKFQSLEKQAYFLPFFGGHADSNLGALKFSECESAKEVLGVILD